MEYVKESIFIDKYITWFFNETTFIFLKLSSYKFISPHLRTDDDELSVNLVWNREHLGRLLIAYWAVLPFVSLL